jgi:hypothetical protein
MCREPLLGNLYEFIPCAENLHLSNLYDFIACAENLLLAITVYFSVLVIDGDATPRGISILGRCLTNTFKDVLISRS